MRVFRTFFLLAAAAYLMPSPPEGRMGLSAQTGEDPPATEFLSAAVSTVADMRDFCTRQASVCDTAHYLAVKLEGKAKYSVELLYQWANESNGGTLPSQALDGEATAVRNLASTSGEIQSNGQNTLQLEDLIPEWRAPGAARQS